LANVEVTDTVLVNSPLYRLLDVDLGQHRLEAVVSLTDFAAYALTMDLLETELVNALATTTPGPISDVEPGVAGSLPLRDIYLPTVASALALDKRLCVAGPVALLAAARGGAIRGHGGPDYVLLIQERSARVLNATGRLAVVPKAFHAPTVEAGQEARLSASLERELEEELLGRQDLEGVPIGKLIRFIGIGSLSRCGGCSIAGTPTPTAWSAWASGSTWCQATSSFPASS
jgi:hypothetical protein